LSQDRPFVTVNQTVPFSQTVRPELLRALLLRQAFVYRGAPARGDVASRGRACYERLDERGTV